MNRKQIESYIVDNLILAVRNSAEMNQVYYANNRAHECLTTFRSKHSAFYAIEKASDLREAEWWAMAGRRAALRMC